MPAIHDPSIGSKPIFGQRQGSRNWLGSSSAGGERVARHNVLYLPLSGRSRGQLYLVGRDSD